MEGWSITRSPSRGRVLRIISPDSFTPELVGDFSKLGVFLEDLETDGEHLYLTVVTGDGPGLIARAPIAVGEVGGPVEVVVSGVGGQPSALVVDEGCVYWTERESGSVFRAKKTPQ